MYLAIKNNLPIAALIFGEVIAVNEYDQKNFGIKSWRSCKDRANIREDEIWGWICEKKTYFACSNSG